MKSKFFLFAMLAGMTLSTVACKKCVTCTKDNASDVEICKDDYNGVPGAYDAAVTTQENAGYTCN
jgi:hypothetical protein